MPPYQPEGVNQAPACTPSALVDLFIQQMFTELPRREWRRTASEPAIRDEPNAPSRTRAGEDSRGGTSGCGRSKKGGDGLIVSLRQTKKSKETLAPRKSFFS